ncbi:MAG: hypothetical protein ACLFM0_05435 [Spirochaetales bacterium]
MLCSVVTGTMLPRRAKTVCVDINSAVAAKLERPRIESGRRNCRRCRAVSARSRG